MKVKEFKQGNQGWFSLSHWSKNIVDYHRSWKQTAEQNLTQAFPSILFLFLLSYSCIYRYYRTYALPIVMIIFILTTATKSGWWKRRDGRYISFCDILMIACQKKRRCSLNSSWILKQGRTAFQLFSFYCNCKPFWDHALVEQFLLEVKLIKINNGIP